MRRGRGGRGRERCTRCDDVSLRVAPGEAVGLVGRNGAGKTSTLRCLAGIVPLDSGQRRVRRAGGHPARAGRRASAPDFSGRENIYLNGALHGFEREEIEERVDAIVEFSELGEFIDVPVKVYSSGMYLRLGFSIAAHLDADVMLIDEILAVGDESFQRKCLARISERMEAGATLVLVSHDPSAIERVCRRVVVLDGGRVAFDGDVAEGLLLYHRLLGTEDGRLAQRAAAASRGALRGAPSSSCWTPTAAPRSVFRPGEALRVRMRAGRAAGARARGGRAGGARRARASAASAPTTTVGDGRDGAVEVTLRGRRAWRCWAATTTWRWARTTRTRRPAALLDRVARFSVAQRARRRGRRRPARQLDRGGPAALPRRRCDERPRRRSRGRARRPRGGARRAATPTSTEGDAARARSCAIGRRRRAAGASGR